MKEEVLKAKQALDALIKKSRVHLYKPIQVGEIYTTTGYTRMSI